MLKWTRQGVSGEEGGVLIQCGSDSVVGGKVSETAKKANKKI